MRVKYELFTILTLTVLKHGRILLNYNNKPPSFDCTLSSTSVVRNFAQKLPIFFKSFNIILIFVTDCTMSD